MKKFNAFLLVILGVSSLYAAKLDQVIVRQQWPWSTDVKIEYKLSDVTKPVDISVRAYNGDVELDQSRLVSALVGDRYGISEDGVGTIILDPVKAFGTEKIALANFKVKLSLSDSAENVNEVIYKIFDLETGTCTDVRRADFFDGKYGAYETDFSYVGTTALSDVLVWTAVTNDVAYKTTKLVMRKIPAKDVAWTMGDSAAVRKAATVEVNGAMETNHIVKLTYDYWMGVFEVTRAQFGAITGRHSVDVTADDADVLPEQSLTFGNNYTEKAATAAYFAGQMRVKTGLQGFDVPSEAEWEFACRAGTDKSLYSGCNASGGWWSGMDNNVRPLAWASGNSGSKAHPVGMLLPNAFGLYDMLGNVTECTRDLRGTDSASYFASFGAGWTPSMVVVDPPSPTGGYYVYRGGAYNLVGAYIRAGDRSISRQNWAQTKADGLRVMLKVAE